MERLTGVIRPYAWGSRTALARLQRRSSPSPAAEAELWLGAHPADPSTVEAGPLDQVIAADPAVILGERVAAEFGSRLPFLLKVLAAEEPLSLQAHPDAARAAAQFAAGNVNYVDDQHKPELLVALDEFETLCGFRDPRVTAELLAGVPVLAPVVTALRAGDLRGALTLIFGFPAGTVDEVLRGGLAEPQQSLAADLAKRYPGDRGMLVALLLNHVTLARGEAIFMPAGNLHCYLRGVGVEILAASDNTLRGGLTPKRVDVPELLEVLNYEPLLDPMVRPVTLAPGVRAWELPVREFALSHAQVDGTDVQLPGSGPRILLCVAGEVTAGGLLLRSGEAAFAPAGTGPVTVTGQGELFQGAVAP
ncbi:mannose-6-phosphate isomerase, class I [Longispora albida]|uniref:mannose-6-phosphate isomerase, class I n=1 Tax=Longispora albida TaxID=203523 RepID=UPI000476275F|nr:mannose-6-phosphate isomerase, class I [Longispora albida]